MITNNKKKAFVLILISIVLVSMQLYGLQFVFIFDRFVRRVDRAALSYLGEPPILLAFLLALIPAAAGVYLLYWERKQRKGE